MVNIFLIFVLFFVNDVLACRWVCIDKNNNIKKHYFDEEKFKVEYTLPVIEVPAISKNVRKRNSTRPEVTLRMPAFEVEPLQGNKVFRDLSVNAINLYLLSFETRLHIIANENDSMTSAMEFKKSTTLSCQSKQFSRSIKEITRKIKCVPRDTIVNIIYEGAKVAPSKVSTKLCQGICSGSKTCLSVDRRNISVAVRTILNNDVQCATVMVPEDVKCKCDCDVSQANCLPTQIYDKKFCKCKCINEEDYVDCLHKIKHSIGKKHTWNKDTCSCECLVEKACTTGTNWNSDECKCVRKIPYY